MCTFNFSLSDASIDRIRPAFKDDAAVQAWLQEQLEMLVMQYKVTPLEEKPHTHSLSHLRGIFANSGMTDKQLRDEYLNEKYGV